MNDEIIALAEGYGAACKINKGIVKSRITICKDRKKAVSAYATSLNSIIVTIGNGSDLASLAADYFSKGAYKDGITNFSNDLSSMVTNANDAISSLQEQVKTISTYLTNLDKYVDSLESVKDKWDKASKYYEKHKDEIITY